MAAEYSSLYFMFLGPPLRSFWIHYCVYNIYIYIEPNTAKACRAIELKVSSHEEFINYLKWICVIP